MTGSKRNGDDALLLLAVGCLLEEDADASGGDGEPPLPRGYRHIRSAVGALLMLGPENTPLFEDQSQ